jgi:hypothetical protein
MVHAAAHVMICGLAAGAPIRGAITLGVGVELEPNNFYGPALAEAHQLESEVAQYPRVVLSQEATHFAWGTAGFSNKPAVEETFKNFNLTERDFFWEDHDGEYVVDFLGERMQSVHAEAGLTFEPIKDAYRFAWHEEKRFEELQDSKHRDRYRRLREYMDARLPLWNLSREGVLRDG